jgi:serine/threonine-protein kinase
MAVPRGATQSLMSEPVGLPRESEAAQPHEGLRLGRYELMVPIAQGGMAEVWIARFTGELGFKRTVALKTIRPDHASNDAFRRAFLDEARIAAGLSHANVVPVLDLGEHSGLLFHVMPLILGGSVATLLRSHQEWLGSDAKSAALPVPIALRIISDALAGLHAAHGLSDERGTPLYLVHRDVSPQNVLVGIDGVARIADFGVAKMLGRLLEETQAGQIRGKPGYLAPEQVERQPLTRSTDVFCAGIVLWEMLTAKRLFRGDARPTTEMMRSKPAQDPRELNPEISIPLAKVILRALSSSPEDRYASALEMNAAIEAVAGGGFASSSVVAQFVQQVCGNRVEELKKRIRSPVEPETARNSVPESLLAASAVDPEPWTAALLRPSSISTNTTRNERPLLATPAPPSRRLRPRLLILAAIALTAIALAWSLLRSPSPPRKTPPAAEQVAKTESAPIADPAAEPSPTAQLDPAAAATSSTAQGARHGPANNKTTTAPKRHLHPKFSNPYAR